MATKAELLIKIGRLQDDIDLIKQELERARVVNFLRVFEYSRGMPLGNLRPNPISLERLEKRIETIEKHISGRSKRR